MDDRILVMGSLLISVAMMIIGAILHNPYIVYAGIGVLVLFAIYVLIKLFKSN